MKHLAFRKTNPLFNSLLFFSAVLLSTCNQTSKQVDVKDGLSSLNLDSLTRHIIVLSSDSFQGRRPFTEGERKTVNYLKQSFASMGIEPGNGNSYFQEVPMVEITPDCDPTMEVQSTRGKFLLKKMDDYVIWTENTDPVISLSDDEVVFAGFGIVAPEYNWDDYAGCDVKGKVVLVMVNDPGYGSGDSTLFKGNTMTYYGRWTYKFEEAARQGAKACLVIHNTKAASYPFSVVQNSWGKGTLHFDTRNDKGGYRCPVEGWITEDAAKKLFMASSGDTSLLLTARHEGFRATPLDLKVKTSMRVETLYNKSKNVIAKITGNKRPDEYIIYTAHWDHFGIGKPDETGDSIYNGAVDNASGTAALLEIACAFKNLKNKPERTIIFLSVTGEEQGLLGSDYYVHHPIYPVKKTVANINMDGFHINGKTKDVVIDGAGQSDLEDYLKKEAESQGRYIAPETHPEAGNYFRSDHFNFAKVGIPALNAGGGIDLVEGGKETGKKLADEYNEKYYHHPSDEFDPVRWKLDGTMEDIQLFFLVGKRLAFETTWPKWKQGSEFKAIRENASNK
ncbi:MAG: M28 family metallopeptidase [Bacteroidales bacterium]